MNKREQLVYTLATSKAKKITPELVIAVGNKLDITKNVALRAWKNYSQLDVKNQKFSRKYKTGDFVGARSEKDVQYAKIWAREKFPHPTRKVYFKTAAKIILEVKNTDAKVYEILDAHEVSRTQYYQWLESLTITGKLLGHKVFDWTKFPKKDIKDVIKFCKHPERFIEESILDTAQLDRLNTVMDNYLK